MALKLGEMLIASNIITQEQLKQALAMQKKEGGRLGTNLVKLGYVTEEKLVAFLSKQFGVPSIKLSDYKIDPAVIKLIPIEMAKKYTIMPVARVGASLTIAMTDPSNVFAIDDVKFMTGYNVEVAVSSETGIMKSIATYYGADGKGGALTRTKQAEEEASSKSDSSSILQAKDYTLDDMDTDDVGGQSEATRTISAEEFDSVVGSALDGIETVEDKDDDSDVSIEAPIVKLVNGILVNAVKSGASDIHIEPYETVLRVRFRVDGVCYTVMNLPTKIKNAITSRLKIMSNLDIAERRIPQDGRIKLKLGKKRDIDFRVNVLPTLFGEKTCMRLLDKGNLQVDLTKLGFDQKAMDDFMLMIEKPYGMILVTGPTGSGKTVTLYSALTHLNKPGINICTAEDPVEFNFMGINQVLVNDAVGLTFAAALKAFLRQDPDIIMVGEIRDFETAEIAVKAALTGHLVLSTLHTNDAPSTISRLLNMGIEPFLVTSSLNVVVAQRLARRICAKCKDHDPSVSVRSLMDVGFTEERAKNLKYMKGKGCPACNNTGYKGRVALFEVMPMTENLKSIILEGGTAEDIKKQMVADGINTLRRSGLAKIEQGITTIEEVLRVTFGD